jgi:predicted RNA-binding Zn ribbon-like protein
MITRDKMMYVEESARVRSWVLADEIVPVRLMATIWADADGLHDDFVAPAELDAWLDAFGIDRHGVAATDHDLVRARALRDSARRLAAYVTGDGRQAAVSAVTEVDDAVEIVNALAAELPQPKLTVDGGHLRLRADPPPSRLVAGLAEIASELQQLLGHEPSELRACHAPGCVLYFAKTHPRREWCSVACGNRTRAARHYRTVRAARAERGSRATSAGLRDSPPQVST